MSTEYIGCMVSIECVEQLGTYQGIIDSIDPVHQALTISHAFHNGVQCDMPKVTILAPDIVNLKLLKSAKEAKEMLKNTVFNFQKPSKSDKQNNEKEIKEKRKEQLKSPANCVQGKSHQSPSKRLSPMCQGQSRKGSSRKDSHRRTPWSETFNDNVKSYQEEFDFEKNHKLFDKKAEFEKIEGKDIVKEAPKKSYRCDENVIASTESELKQIRIGDSTVKATFLTDSGIVIPAISLSKRIDLFEKAAELGVTVERRLETCGRSAAEMVMNLLGGANRLNPANAHQTPFVVVLAGPHPEGALAVNCARQLSCHGIKITLFVPKTVSAGYCSILENEIRIFLSTGSHFIRSVADLPKDTVDMVISGVDSHRNTDANQRHSWCIEAKIWAEKLRAPIIALDPPQEPHKPALNPKWSLSLGLPLKLSEFSGKMYLSDLAIPKQVFKQVGISYQSPFGHKYVIPIYKRD